MNHHHDNDNNNNSHGEDAEREGFRGVRRCFCCFVTPSPPIKSFDFRGFDSSRLLILRGGNYHVR